MAASESKLFARASKVVRIVSLTKLFWTKLEDIVGKGVLFNSAKGQNWTNHRAAGPAVTSCLRRLMESTKLCNTPFLFIFKIDVCRLCFLNRNAPLIGLGYKKSKRSLHRILDTRCEFTCIFTLFLSGKLYKL